MSWHSIQFTCSQEPEGESSPIFCSDIPPSPRAKSKTILDELFYSGSLMEFYQCFPFGTTLERFDPTIQNAQKHSKSGKEYHRNSPFVAGSRSHARTSAAQEKEQVFAEEKAGFGSIFEGSLERSIQGLSLSKIPRYCGRADLALCCETLPRWGMMQDGECWELATLKRPTFGSESGFWPTPSGVKDRGHCVGAISEWGGSSNRFRGTELRNLRCPDFEEWMMAWPVSWTELTPLETDKFQSWLRLHSRF